MSKMEKVISGLSCCKSGAQDSVHDGALRQCHKCPYAQEYPCTSRLAADALELLKRQGTFECPHCGCRALIWDSDYTYVDCKMGEGSLMQMFTCDNCGARVECYIGEREEEDDDQRTGD